MLLVVVIVARFSVLYGSNGLLEQPEQPGDIQQVRLVGLGCRQRAGQGELD